MNNRHSGFCWLGIRSKLLRSRRFVGPVLLYIAIPMYNTTTAKTRSDDPTPRAHENFGHHHCDECEISAIDVIIIFVAIEDAGNTVSGPKFCVEFISFTPLACRGVIETVHTSYPICLVINACFRKPLFSEAPYLHPRRIQVLEASRNGV